MVHNYVLPISAVTRQVVKVRSRSEAVRGANTKLTVRASALHLQSKHTARNDLSEI